jgi:hypothetical protein
VKYHLCGPYSVCTGSSSYSSVHRSFRKIEAADIESVWEDWVIGVVQATNVVQPQDGLWSALGTDIAWTPGVDVGCRIIPWIHASCHVVRHAMHMTDYTASSMVPVSSPEDVPSTISPDIRPNIPWKGEKSSKGIGPISLREDQRMRFTDSASSKDIHLTANSFGIRDPL